MSPAAIIIIIVVIIVIIIIIGIIFYVYGATPDQYMYIVKIGNATKYLNVENNLLVLSSTAPKIGFTGEPGGVLQWNLKPIKYDPSTGISGVGYMNPEFPDVNIFKNKNESFSFGRSGCRLYTYIVEESTYPLYMYTEQIVTLTTENTWPYKLCGSTTEESSPLEPILVLATREAFKLS